MKKTVRNAVLAAMVLTTVCGGAQMSWAEDVNLSNYSGTTVFDTDNKMVAGVLEDEGQAIASKNENINVTTKDTDNIWVFAVSARAPKNQQEGQYSKITLGTEETKTINVSSTGKYAYGLFSGGKGSNITVNGDTLTINVHGKEYAIGMHAQSNSQTPAAEIDINTKNTIINASTEVEEAPDGDGESPAIGIISYSGSKVTINNNLTVNAATAISTRGNSTININPDGTGTVKLNGDISFDYNSNFAGAEHP